jgi:parallel beta-helix repeat protein
MMTLLGITVIISFSIWKQYQHQLEVSESITHKQKLARASKSFSEKNLQAALKDAESILDSKYVGSEARLLYARILVQSQQTFDAVFILEKLLDEKPEIAGDARELLRQIYLDAGLSDAEKLRIAQKVPGKTIYVDANAAGTNDGTSWVNAYKFLQDALIASLNGDEIKVAAGIYKTDQGTMITKGDREATFQLKRNVPVYGGIGGESILSGDLNDNDGLDFAGNDENSYHVVNGSNTNEGTILDGFTIIAGNANGYVLHDKGGGMYIKDGSPTITNCTFIGNTAIDAGGMLAESCNSTITNCTFIGNSAKRTGGAIWNHYGNPIITNCSFIGNSADSKGGMKNQNSNPMVKDCRFIRNVAYTSGAGMNNLNSNPTVINCTFENNSAELSGGGMKNKNSSPILTNCTFIGNSARENGGGIEISDNSNPTISNCVFRGNSAGYQGGGMFNQTNSSPTIINCTFVENRATKDAGGMANDQSSPIVINCIFKGNSAGEDGGGMCNSKRSNPKLTNCLFSRNSADKGGGGVAIRFSEPNVINCTFDNNSAKVGGAIGHSNESSPKLVNCILWNNIAAKGPQVSLEYSSVTVKYCNFKDGSPGIYVDQNSSVAWDISNIDAKPLFVDAANDDYRLQAGSPCIDAGDNSAIPSSVTMGLDENPRIVNGIVDMGAYECKNPLPINLRASNPEPADRTNIGSVSQLELRWGCMSEVSTYKVYFGTDPDNLTLHGDVQQKGSMMSPILKKNCQYFWRVYAVQTNGSVIPGIVWSFRTVEGFDLYADDIGPNIIESSGLKEEFLDYYTEDNPVSGDYCIHLMGIDQYRGISLCFLPIKDLSMLVDTGFVLDFWIRCKSSNAEIVMRFVDTKTDDPNDHPWRMMYKIDENVAVWNGTWNHLQIPLYKFSEHGSFDGDRWYSAVGAFDWTAVEYFEIWAEFGDLKGIDFYFDDIRIVEPNPASPEHGIKPDVHEGKKDAD